MITAITPTGDRKKAFNLCQRWMGFQYLYPDQWIVVDDGKTPMNIYASDVQYIRREPQANEGHTLSINLQLALKYAEGDKIIIIEDDDYYAPDYIEFMSEQLDKYDLVGFEQARYYHITAQKYHRFKNQKDYASLCQTAFRKEIVNDFIKELKVNEKFLDVRFWLHSERNKKLFNDDGNILQVGIKGLDGRKGIGAGHKIDFEWYEQDVNYRVLKSWIPKDYKYYLTEK